MQMAEMCNKGPLNRRKRSKREGTFLEQVKQVLHQLTTEVADIKSSLSELKEHLVDPPVNFSHWSWDDWKAWDSLGFEEHAWQLAQTQTATTYTEPQPLAQFVTPELKAEHGHAISRSTMMSLRADALAMGKPACGKWRTMLNQTVTLMKRNALCTSMV